MAAVPSPMVDSRPPRSRPTQLVLSVLVALVASSPVPGLGADYDRDRAIESASVGHQLGDRDLAIFTTAD